MSLLMEPLVAVAGSYAVSVSKREGFQEEEVERVFVGKNGFGFGGTRRRVVTDEENGDGEESSRSSSIGVGEGSSLSLSSLDREEEEVESVMKKAEPLDSLEALEESLPIKRGLSNFFNGKSKSFACLSEAALAATTAKDLAKPENPFNKRRRIPMSCRSSWRRRASCSSLVTVASLPPLSTPNLSSLEESEEEEEDDEEEEEGGEEERRNGLSSLNSMKKRMMVAKEFKGPRPFSFGNLQQHDRFPSQQQQELS